MSAVIIPKKGLKREVEEEEEEESNSDSGSNEEGSEYEDSEDDSEADSRALKAAYREVTVLKQFPRHYYPELAKYLVDCPMMGCDDAASAFLRLYPGPGLKLVCVSLSSHACVCLLPEYDTPVQTASAIRRIAVKEKRRGDTRLCWYIRPEVSELLDGVELDCEALLPSVDAAPKGKSDTRVKASKVVKEVRVGRREEKATPITVEVVKERKKPGRKPKQVVVSPRVPPQAVILSKGMRVYCTPMFYSSCSFRVSCAPNKCAQSKESKGTLCMAHWESEGMRHWLH